MSQTPLSPEFAELGEQLRVTRIESQRTLEAVGQHVGDECTSRQWSHAHLSKVERGMEKPDEDLVRHYAHYCNGDVDALVTLFRAASRDGLVTLPHAVATKERQSHLKRREIVLDLSDTPRMMHTFDFLADTPLSSVVAVVECGTPAAKNFVVTLGGDRTPTEIWRSDGVVALDVALASELEPQTRHRLVIEHEAPDILQFCRAIVVTPRRGRLADVLVTVKGAPPQSRWWPIGNVVYDLVDAAFVSRTTAPTDVFRGDQPLVAGSDGSVQVQHSGVTTGCYVGLGWEMA